MASRSSFGTPLYRAENRDILQNSELLITLVTYNLF